MSFAIIETGGKQYKVSASKILKIEKLNIKVGETIKFDNVLLLNDDKSTEIGSPRVEGATVEAKLLDNVKDRTILVFHKRRRKHSRKKNGHRQQHSKIQITKILYISVIYFDINFCFPDFLILWAYSLNLLLIKVFYTLSILSK